MALPDSVKLVIGTDIVLADTTDHSPATANNIGTRTDQIDLTSVANTAARQSDKFDFGANWDRMYNLAAVLEFAATPVAGEYVNFYLAPSNSATNSTANPGGVSGSDSAYTGYSSNLAASLKHLIHIGTMITTAQATGSVQIDMSIGIFTPPLRYGTLVVENQSDAAFHSDMVETSIVLSPIVEQIQD